VEDRFDGGSNWREERLRSFAGVGFVTVDSSYHRGRSARIFAGTGEPNNSDSYYGRGVLFSSDAGETWAAEATATFLRAAFLDARGRSSEQ